MEQKKTKESQNQIQIDLYRQKGSVRLGPWASYIWRNDPKHLGFLLARYKFCAKMLTGKKSVLEVGCGDAIGIPVILQTVEFVHGIDFEPLVLQDAKARLASDGTQRCDFSIFDITEGIMDQKFDAAYSLDVIEHIQPKLENRFMTNICGSLKPHGVFIVGTPNIEAHKHASPLSASGHVNLKSAQALRELFLRYFHNVFIFSMSDEVVHTGYYPMAHYLLAVGAGCKEIGL